VGAAGLAAEQAAHLRLGGRPRWKELVGQSIIARILRQTDGVDVHIIADERARSAGRPAGPSE
jgi:K+-sensing histidine kinase KdpD